jgi:hypothetical protein
MPRSEDEMNQTATLTDLVPHAAPTDKVARAILIAIRRLAVGGLMDAQATTILIGDFGLAYRRPLMFLRVLVGEVSRIAARQIAVAPCCCPRMTDGEAAFLRIIHVARNHPENARASLVRLTGSLDCLPAISVAQALADALDDIGHPLCLAQNQDSLV